MTTTAQTTITTAIAANDTWTIRDTAAEQPRRDAAPAETVAALVAWAHGITAAGVGSTTGMDEIVTYLDDPDTTWGNVADIFTWLIVQEQLENA